MPVKVKTFCTVHFICLNYNSYYYKFKKKYNLPFGGLANIDVKLAEYISPITYVADNISKPATNRILELSDGVIVAISRIQYKNNVSTYMIVVQILLYNIVHYFYKYEYLGRSS